MFSKRVENIPKYVFKELDIEKEKLKNKGIDFIDMSVGDPDIGPPKEALEVLKQEILINSNHLYPPYEGTDEFRDKVKYWMKRRFSVNLEKENILALLGTKEGIAHFSMSFVDIGDKVLIPSIAFPVYGRSTILSNGICKYYSLDEGFQPNLNMIEDVFKKEKIKVIFVNYPHNPTGASIKEKVMKNLVELCHKYGVIICSDMAYSEIYEFKPPLSFLNIPGAESNLIEFYSLSKTGSVPGWRVGYAVGNKRLIQGLKIVKENVDSGVYKALLKASETILDKSLEYYGDLLRSIYRKRRQIMKLRLKKIKLQYFDTEYTSYIWIKVPKGYTSASFCQFILDKCNILLTPGSGFGEAGEGYIRMSLTLNDRQIKKAAEFLSKSNIKI